LLRTLATTLRKQKSDTFITKNAHKLISVETEGQEAYMGSGATGACALNFK